VRETFLDGGYYKIDVSKNFSLLSMNTLQYNKKQIKSEIGPEAEN
jgi:hypothetical protein